MKIVNIYKGRTNDKRSKLFWKRDPRFFHTLIKELVRIETTDGKTHIGRVYLVAPVTKTVYTIRIEDGIVIINIFPIRIIKSLIVFGSNIVFFKNTHTIATKLNKKKMAVKAWLTKNLLDVKEVGMILQVGNDLVIKPPYDHKNCHSDNSKTLERIKKVLKYMPAQNK